MVQAQTHLSGAARSVELAAVGRRVCENEWDLLDLLTEAGALPAGEGGGEPPGGWGAEAVDAAPGLHGRPTAAELVEAVREFLERDAIPGLEGRARFHALVAANVCATVERELRLGPAQVGPYSATLARLGVASEAGLAAGIRAGAFDARPGEVAAAVRAIVAARLAVANPSYAAPAPPATPAAPDARR
jgi:hypothetical protein